jgi:hypothetical protein
MMTQKRSLSCAGVSLWAAVLTAAIVTLASGGACGADPPKHVPPERKHGWSWTPRKDAVSPDCGRRNPLFYVGEPVVFTLGPSAASYEVRDYWGELVDHGPAGPSVTLKVKQPGWYKLYIYGKQATKEWGDVVGGTTLVVFRPSDKFPQLPPKGTPGGGGTEDEVIRAVAGIGPQRHAANADKPDESIRELEKSIAIDRAMYLPYDPLRQRALMIAFSNGTRGKEAGVRRVVEHFKDVVRYYEPRNEPNYGSSGKDFLERELKPFHAAVKGVDRNLKVMGPGTVAIGPSLLPFIEDFLKAGGGDYIDVFSFHVYNGINGDLVMGRKSMDGLLALLKKYGAEKKELWQTEQGYFAAMYGAYQPRHQGRWTMLEMMLFDQYGLPREHNHLWYDRSHGFWDFPTWWENDDGGFNPAVPLMRVLAEEQFGTRFSRAFDFGEPGNKLYLGSLFESPDRSKAVAMFASAGSPDGKVPLQVSGGDVLHVISAFGVEQDLPVRGGSVVLSVPELPVYVELARGQKIEVVPTDWGPNLARAEGATAMAAYPPAPPKNLQDAGQVKAAQRNKVAKIINGELENWYYAQQPGDGPWMDNAPAFPTWVEVRLPAAAGVARVIVYAAPPWQSQGTLLDYELQYEREGRWVTLAHVREPPRCVPVFTPPTRTSVDSFFSDRWIFQHSFPSVTTRKIRLLVHDVTWGGGATREETEAGGQTGPHQMTLRELEIYGK